MGHRLTWLQVCIQSECEVLLPLPRLQQSDVQSRDVCFYSRIAHVPCLIYHKLRKDTNLQIGGSDVKVLLSWLKCLISSHRCSIFSHRFVSSWGIGRGAHRKRSSTETWSRTITVIIITTRSIKVEIFLASWATVRFWGRVVFLGFIIGEVHN
jgi:hypothetical protein